MKVHKRIHTGEKPFSRCNTSRNTRLSENQGYWRNKKEFTLVINHSAAHSVTRSSLKQIFWRLLKESMLMKNPLAAKGVITNVNNQLHSDLSFPLVCCWHRVVCCVSEKNGSRKVKTNTQDLPATFQKNLAKHSSDFIEDTRKNPHHWETNQLLTIRLQMLYIRQSKTHVRTTLVISHSATKSVITNANNQLHWRHTKESTSMRNHPAAQSVTRYSVSQDARMAFTKQQSRTNNIFLKTIYSDTCQPICECQVSFPLLRIRINQDKP